MSGFVVHVERRARAAYPADMQAALGELARQLEGVRRLPIAPSVLRDLMEVPFFVEWARTGGGAQYHPSREWLGANGYRTEKARSVEISNAQNFVAWSRANQPAMVLHELAHAYHHRALGYGFAPIADAYAAALDAGLLGQVPYHSGGGETTQRESYARTDDREYFAELTEAYFLRNDFYPFVRADLQAYDAVGFALMEQVWGAR